MRGLQFSEKILFYLQCLALLGLVARMLAGRLHRVYRFFFAYLVIAVLQLFIPFFVSPRKNLYTHLYLPTEGLIVCFYALNVLELYTFVLRDLPGIGTTARRYIRISLGIAIAISVLLLQFDPMAIGFLSKFYTFERTIVCSLVFFVFLITAFLFYFPIPLNRNVIYYSIGYAFYFTTKAVALLLRNTGETWFLMTDVAVLAGSTACLLFWIIFLTPQGERRKMIFANRWKHDDEDRLIGQLQAINASLMRARK